MSAGDNWYWTNGSSFNGNFTWSDSNTSFTATPWWMQTGTRPLTAAAKPQPMSWQSDIAFENHSTIDGRHIAAGALSWRDLPLTLMAMTVNSGSGHVGSYVAGRIDKLSKRSKNMDGEALPEGVKSLYGQGSFDVHGENGGEISRLVEGGMLRGISIDLAPQEIGLRDKQTGEIVPEKDIEWEHVERYFAGEMELAFIKATMLAATVCPTPAFDHARIGLVASAARDSLIVERTSSGVRLGLPSRVTVLTDAAFATSNEVLVASAAPPRPPRAWFETQEPPGPMPLTITPEGRVFGHVALWDSCHVGFGDRCVQPPRSQSNYAYFHTGQLQTDEGTNIDIGKLMFNGTHASLGMDRLAASRHYDNNSCVGAYVRASDGKHGIWIAGALRSGLSENDIAEIRANPLSGDWRPVNGQLEMISALAVPVPGLPVPRAQVAVTASGSEVDVTALVLSSGTIARDSQVTQALVAAGVLADPFAQLPVDDQREVLTALVEEG